MNELMNTLIMHIIVLNVLINTIHKPYNYINNFRKFMTSRGFHTTF